MNDELECADDVIFLIEITDGYSFRNLIDYLRYTNTDGTFIFSKKRILFDEFDGDSTVFKHLVIKTCNLSKYIYNYKKENYYCSVQLSELQSSTRKIGKKDGVRLYQKYNDINLYIQILSTNKGGRENILFAKTKTPDLENYHPFDEADFEFKRSHDEPNANCILSDFAKTMKALTD